MKNAHMHYVLANWEIRYFKQLYKIAATNKTFMVSKRVLILVQTDWDFDCVYIDLGHDSFFDLFLLLIFRGNFRWRFNDFLLRLYWSSG